MSLFMIHLIEHLCLLSLSYKWRQRYMFNLKVGVVGKER
jgi:hypothetical protein